MKPPLFSYRAPITIDECVAVLAADADAVVLVTEWAEFAELDLDEVSKAMRGNLLVDGRNFLDPVAVRGAGLIYEGIGRPSA